MQDYKRPKELVRDRPTPMFGYNSAEGYWDIPFPDFTFFGHEHSWLNGVLPRCPTITIDAGSSRDIKGHHPIQQSIVEQLACPYLSLLFLHLHCAAMLP